MAVTNHERVGKALQLLNRGLQPFVERELKAVYKDRWQEMAQAGLRAPLVEGHWDIQALLNVIEAEWRTVFDRKLSRADRTLAHELRDVRNRWAHQNTFSGDDAYRALDSVQRLLQSVAAAEEVAEADRQKQELLRVRFDEQTRRETRKVAAVPIEGQPTATLRPWREIITPHPDVASGRYQQAEFAADLSQVHRGEGADEYRKPRDFFGRTFLTEGLRHLLVGALRRLDGSGGDPIVELQTNFGGGKTHSMLALYHLFGGTPVADLPGVEPLLQESGVAQLPGTQRVVLVGTALSPGREHRKPDGTVVRTLWGELAWQLLGSEGCALVAEDDRHGVSPGSEALKELLELAGPSLILIDEWVAYVRQLYGVSGLPAGSFDANLTFAQALTEAAKATRQTLLVASIPASDIEIGGEGGREALQRLRNTFGRIESAWRPASAEEGFEIVRRRLFQPIVDPRHFALRDAVVREFAGLYRGQPQEFPPACREGDYERRMQAAYPIHPELFDRLYNDWSTLDRFQRTRGVLRLMAAVIHSLWERQDASLLILPAAVPVDEPAVQFELTQYMDDPWVPVIEKDVDGPHSLPLRLDRENPNFGRYSACRRVARTLYLGSAPTLHAANRGLEDRQIKLGSAQPGESVATFGDALRRLTDGATHLYLDGRRYWFSTQPSVTRLAQDRAAQQDSDAVLEEIEKRLREEGRRPGDFARVHACPVSGADVPDERDAQLVILSPSAPHAARDAASPARAAAQATLDSRGTSPRRYRNALVFLAADKTRLAELDSAVRQYLAWRSIEAERETLNLDAFSANQAKTKRDQADETIRARLPETYSWLLAPGLPDASARSDALEWQELRLQGQDPLAVRAAKKLRNEELLLTTFGGTRLRMELDRVPLWRGDHVPLKQLAEDFAQYLYLPRLKDDGVLLEAVRSGLGDINWRQDTFAYAEGYDESQGRYLGLRAGQHGAVTLEGGTLVVKPDVAAAQFDQTPPPGIGEHSQPFVTGSGTGGSTSPGPRLGVAPPAAAPKLRRFHGSAELNPTLPGRDAAQIAEAVIAHLSGLVGARVTVTLEVQAELLDGAPEHVVRTVTENCRTLRFRSYDFEET